jgi:opacity protein-like surface antigen
VSQKIGVGSISAAFTLPISKEIDATGRLGFASTSVSINGQKPSTDKSKSALTGGLGLSYKLNQKVDLRLDLDVYKAPDVSKTDNIIVATFGAGYRF